MATMIHAHSQRTMRNPPRVDSEYLDGRKSDHVAYDPSDMLELNARIAAKCKVPRAELSSSRVEASPGDVLRRVIERER